MNAWHTAPILAAGTNDLVSSKLESGATIQFTISTRSMLPTLKPGDRVLARGIRAGEPHIGDILLVRSDRYWLAHRLIDRRVIDGRLYLVTQGDYSTAPDGLWSSDQIYGKIVLLQRDGSDHSLEMPRVRWFGALIAGLLRWRSKTATKSLGLWKTMALRMNSALVRGAVWFGYKTFK